MSSTKSFSQIIYTNVKNDLTQHCTVYIHLHIHNEINHNF